MIFARKKECHGIIESESVVQQVKYKEVQAHSYNIQRKVSQVLQQRSAVF
jgi:hypothetical protein